MKLPGTFKIDKKYVPLILLGLIILAGIFLRTYHFAEWIRFNDDQARDATFVRGFLSGRKDLPLLGPNASGTRFRLGPLFYYFQYASGKIFGGAPDRLAYPDLFFSVLAIPMFFFFLRKFFSDRISGAVTALYGLSYYAIEYSRFAWNPNSLPFFTLLFLFALSELAEQNRKNKTVWAILAGIALGVGIQLHTLFLLIAPFVLIAFCIVTLRKKPRAWKTTVLLIVVATLLNIPQLSSEIRTGGANTGEFITGIIMESTPFRLLGEYAMVDGVCQVRNNAMIVSASGGLEDCHLAGFRAQLATEEKALGTFGRIIILSGLFIGIIFSVGGYLLLLLRIRKETDAEKKRGLLLVSVYAITAFLIFIPFATEMTSRYFLVVEFVPFLFLALWFESAEKRSSRFGPIIIVIVTIILAFLNLRALSETFASYEGAHPERVTMPESVTVSEIRRIAGYMQAHAGVSDTIYVDDRSGDLFGMIKGLSYFLEPSGITIRVLNGNTRIKQDTPVFSIDLAKISTNEELTIERSSREQLVDYRITDNATFGRFTTFDFVRN
ncbi:MAG: glycosyltransferase family 39 protein [Candidatus Moraniibacteriota bacterium]